MSTRFIDKVTLRSIVAIIAISSLVSIVMYFVLRSDARVSITGSIDISQLFTAFLTLIGVVLGWLFGRQER